MKRRALVLVVCGWLAVTALPAAASASPQVREDGVAQLLRRIERVMAAGQPDAYLELLSTYADRGGARDAARALVSPAITRVVVRERDRQPLEGTLPGDGHRLMVEIFVEYGDRARVSTWRLDTRRRADDQGNDVWVISGQQQLSFVDGLYRLSLNPARQYRVRDLVVRSEDLELRVADGRMFVAETQEGTMAVVLLPRSDGVFVFSPTPETERDQVKLFAGTQVIEDGFDAAFIRVNPGEFKERFPGASLELEAVEPGSFRRADAIFKEDLGKTFSLDLGDMSREPWSLSPGAGDFLAEVRTNRFRTLTYAKSSGDPEDISLFDRRRRRNISVYPSRANVAARGRFFDEDALVPYDIMDYEIDVRFDPDRDSMDGTTRLRLKATNSSMNALTLKIAESLTVRTVFSPELGRLLFLRVRGQNAIVINLPAAMPPGLPLTLLVEYDGPITAAQFEHEAIAVGAGQEFSQDVTSLPLEQSRLYTNRSFWYPQAGVTDYASAVMRITVPDGYGVLASGEPAPESPVAVAPPPGQRAGSRRYTFTASQPARYLSCIVARFSRADTRTVPLADMLTVPGADGSRQFIRGARPGVFYDSVRLSVDTTQRLRSKGKRTGDTAADILRFYTGLVGDVPYPSLSLGLVEKELPGGHSPAYMNVINQPLPQSTYSWGNDPAAFQNFPEFFVAHEIAHQWWGQAVGWKSYHEQWISEGFAQYFAALYARQKGGDAAFDDVMRRMARFARDQSLQGPISLGYRLGHVKGDPRVFRSLVYNKAAVVLHHLRLLLGDEVFLRGLRRFYFERRFQKAAASDVRAAFEAESGQDLSVFFEEWFNSSGIPVVKFSWKREGTGADAVVIVRFEQVGSVFDLPIPVTLQLPDNRTRDVLVPVRQQVVEHRIPAPEDVKDVVVNASGLALVDVYREPGR